MTPTPTTPPALLTPPLLIDPTPSETKYPEAARILRTAASATEGNAYQRWQGGEGFAVKEAVALSAVQAALVARDEQMRQALAGLLQHNQFNDDVDDYADGHNQATEVANDRIRAAAAALGLGERGERV